MRPMRIWRWDRGPGEHNAMHVILSSCRAHKAETTKASVTTPLNNSHPLLPLPPGRTGVNAMAQDNIAYEQDAFGAHTPGLRWRPDDRATLEGRVSFFFGNRYDSSSILSLV